MNIHGKHTILMAAMAAMALTGCSGDEDAPRVPAEQGGFSFSVAVDDGDIDGKSSRAYGANPDADIITKVNFNERSPYFPIVIVRNSDPNGVASKWLSRFGSDWHLAQVASGASNNAKNNWHYEASDFVSMPEYWDETATDFYAISGFANHFRYEGIPQIEKLNNDKQWSVRNVDIWNSCLHDFIWSYRQEKRNADQWETGGKVNLVFNHAMARLRFTFRNTNKNIKVEVRDVYVANIYRSASFSLTKARDIYMGTDLQRDLPANHNNVSAYNLGQIWFDYCFKAKADLRTGMNRITLDGVAGPYTAQSTQGGEYAFTVIPQTVNRWDHTNAQHLALTKEATSANYSYPGYDKRRENTNNLPGYLVINCVIRDRNTGVLLWESRNYDNENNEAHKENGAYNTDFERLNGIIVPLTPGTDASYTWLPSRTYTYNVVFGEGAGWDGNGDPAIAPVGITASVAGFSSQDVWVPAN